MIIIIIINGSLEYNTNLTRLLHTLVSACWPQYSLHFIDIRQMVVPVTHAVFWSSYLDFGPI